MKTQLSNLSIFFVCAILLLNCNDADIMPKEYPYIMMTDVEPSETGVIFRAEVLNAGSYNVQSFGFVWSSTNPAIENSDTIQVSAPFTEGYFEKEVNYGLAKGLNYSVRPFVVYNSITVYGNALSFESLGSLRNSWEKLNPQNADLDGWSKSFGSSMNDKGFILFQSSDFFSYDPVENSFSRVRNFPISGNTRSKFISVTIGSSQYFFNNIDLNLYKYENDIWTNLSNIPVRDNQFHRYFQGLSNGNSIMILSSSESHEYNLTTNTWIARSLIPTSTGFSVGGTAMGSKAYVLTSDKSIWEYDSDTHTWRLLTEYPGIIKDKIISFSLNNKIYFGISSDDYIGEDNWLDKELWSYDLTQDKWEAEDPFPSNLDPNDIHYFFVNNKLYIGHEFEFHNYDLWVFDPSKN